MFGTKYFWNSHFLVEVMLHMKKLSQYKWLSLLSGAKTFWKMYSLTEFSRKSYLCCGRYLLSRDLPRVTFDLPGTCWIQIKCHFVLLWLNKLNPSARSVQGGGGLCMMSLPVWLPGPMFLPGGLCPGGLGGGVCCSLPYQIGSLSGRSLSREVLYPVGSVRAGLCQGDHLYGEEPAVSILLECILFFFFLCNAWKISGTQEIMEMKTSIKPSGWSMISQREGANFQGRYADLLLCKFFAENCVIMKEFGLGSASLIGQCKY